MMRLGAIVPTHNHIEALSGIVAQLISRGIPVLVIDDGSAPEARARIAKLATDDGQVQVHHLDQNRGKGAAVLSGFRTLRAGGFTHALQIDADGQHSLAALESLIALATANPEALISGRPVYDRSIPLGRKLGRWITHFWVWVETLSFDISDSMCGFRIYPLDPVSHLIERVQIGTRMDFDTEIIVRLFWANTPVLMHPVDVTYPTGDHSNFRMFSDNALISWMHTRLFFGMLVRVPVLLVNKRRSVNHGHWASTRERGGYWGLRIVMAVYALLGARICNILISPIIFWYFLTGTMQRRASLDYLARVARTKGNTAVPGLRAAFAHFRSFGRMAIERLAAWRGDITVSDLILPADGELERLVDAGTGIFVISSHIGNVDVCRALSRRHPNFFIDVLMDTRHAANFKRAIDLIAPDSQFNVFQIDAINPATMVDLAERANIGHWIALAGDRTPANGRGRIQRISFLGRPARFSEGPIIVAHLLGRPVYLMFCLREGDRHRVIFEKFAGKIELSRGDRQADIAHHLFKYVKRLEEICIMAPNQWYNFYDFWDDGPLTSRSSDNDQEIA
jgi:predicted LPLAT superfamily acyltransferase